MSVAGVGSEGTALVSVIVPIRNEERTIEQCLAALTSQVWPADRLEILVVDGGSSDRTRALVTTVAAADHRIELLDNPGRIAATALNIGIAKARGDVIARIDGHASPGPDHIRIGVEALERTQAWAVGGPMRRSGQARMQRAIGLAMSSPIGVGGARHNYANEAGPAETVFQGMWPRWVFDVVGRFDEELVRNQDDEFSYRIREAGGLIWYEPRLEISYETRATLRLVYSQYRQYGYWKVRVFQKHAGAVRPRQLLPAAWIATLAVSLGTLPFTPLALVPLVPATLGYVATMAIESVRLRQADTPARMILGAFVAMHAGYGTGFWQGLVRFAPNWLRRG